MINKISFYQKHNLISKNYIDYTNKTSQMITASPALKILGSPEGCQMLQH